MDAIVAERLTASPRIYAIYGTCGIGIMSEYFPHGTLEEMAIPEDDIYFHTDDDEGPLISYNDLPGLTKLKISLHMAEALADLHGYSGGTIVHQDVVRLKKKLIAVDCNVKLLLYERNITFYVCTILFKIN